MLNSFQARKKRLVFYAVEHTMNWVIFFNFACAVLGFNGFALVPVPIAKQRTANMYKMTCSKYIERRTVVIETTCV